MFATVFAPQMTYWEFNSQCLSRKVLQREPVTVARYADNLTSSAARKGNGNPEEAQKNTENLFPVGSAAE